MVTKTASQKMFVRHSTLVKSCLTPKDLTNYGWLQIIMIGIYHLVNLRNCGVLVRLSAHNSYNESPTPTQLKVICIICFWIATLKTLLKSIKVQPAVLWHLLYQPVFQHRRCLPQSPITIPTDQLFCQQT